MKTKTIFLLSLLGVSNIAFAEGNCPDGMVPIPNGCMPTHDTVTAASAPAQPRGRWETRWGAIAIDDSKSRLGAIKGAKSKRQASKAAIAQCRAEGGGEGCKVKLTFYNQCSAIAWGDTTYRGGGRPTLGEATNDAMKSCNEATANCKIVYADCSPAVWIQ